MSGACYESDFRMTISNGIHLNGFETCLNHATKQTNPLHD